MYLLYIDDSGTCDLKKDEIYSPNGGSSRYFVLGAILIKAHNLNELEPFICDLKSSCFNNSLEEIKHSMKSQKLKCKITCDEEKPNKVCFHKKIAQLINSVDCTVFVTVQDKYYTTSHNVVKSKDDIYRLCFENLLKSVDTFMFNNKISEDTITFIDKKNSGNATDTLIYNSYKSALKNNKIYKSFANNIFSPTINVVYSQYTSGAQLADFIAGSVWSFFENTGNEIKQKELKEITKIYSSKVYTYDNKKIGLSFCKDFLK